MDGLYHRRTPHAAGLASGAMGSEKRNGAPPATEGIRKGGGAERAISGRGLASPGRGPPSGLRRLCPAQGRARRGGSRLRRPAAAVQACARSVMAPAPGPRDGRSGDVPFPPAYSMMGASGIRYEVALAASPPPPLERMW